MEHIIRVLRWEVICKDFSDWLIKYICFFFLFALNFHNSFVLKMLSRLTFDIILTLSGIFPGYSFAVTEITSIKN